MIKKISSVLGFAFLFVLGATADGYSDSLPGMAGHTWNTSDASCIGSSWSTATNNCNRSVKLLIPAQSRITGNLKFYASKPYATADVYPTKCRVVATNFYNDYQWQTPQVTLKVDRTQTQLGNQTWPVYSDTVLHYDCDLTMNYSSISSVSWKQ